MKRVVVLIALVLVAFPAIAAKKSCQALKAEIAAKIESHGVKEFSLKVESKDATVLGKVVGSCDGGTKKIVYRRG